MRRGIQEEQIDVGVDRHLAPRVAAHRHHGEALAELGAAGVELLLRQPEQTPDQAVREVGVGLVDELSVGPGPVERLQVLAGRGEVGPHAASNAGFDACRRPRAGRRPRRGRPVAEELIDGRRRRHRSSDATVGAASML